MSKKAQVYSQVSAAINLDSKGERKNAFQKYLQCLHMLSTFLLEQYHRDDASSGFDQMDDNWKNELKQTLSVICDCADRAGSILIPKELEREAASLFGMKSNQDRLVQDAACNFMYNSNSASVSCDFKSECSSNIDEKNSLDSSGASWRNLSSSSLLQDQSHFSSPRLLRRMNSKSRYPVFSKVDEENASLFKRYQMRINNAKDKYTKENLQLELQRRLAENLSIAKARREEAFRKQKEEKEKALDQALRGMMSQNVPCGNAVQQEKRELYLEVLYYEAAESHFFNLDENSDKISSPEIIQRIFERTLRCSHHPLFQWLTMIQMKLKKSLSALLKEHTSYISLLPGKLPDKRNTSSYKAVPSIGRRNLSKEQQEELEHLRASLEAIAQSIRESTDVIMEVIFAAYKSQLPEEADTAFYKATECSLISPLWPLITTLFRISNIPSEWKILETMENCQKFLFNFGISADRLADYEDIYLHSIQQLKKMLSLISLVDKLSILVNISQKLSTCGKKQTVEASERLLGADELVPVLSYVLVRSGLPHLASECYALQALVDAKYMLGEEGYALTSFLTALNYLEMKELISPEDYHNMNDASPGGSELSDNSLSN